MQRRLILHIGTEKTGTTALQHWLSLHRASLRSVGFELASVLGATNHRRLPTSCFEPDRIDDFVIRSGLADDLPVRLATYQRWQDQFFAAVQVSDAPTWLVSSEHLSSRLTHEAELQRLKQLLDQLQFRVEVLIYLRDPLATAVSAWSTLVLNGGYGYDVLPAPDDPVLADKCNHRLLVQRWLCWFPHLHVRLYSRDLLADFCRAIGWPEGLLLLPSRSESRMNTSLPHAALIEIARLNHAHPVYRGSALNPERQQRIAEVMERCHALPAYQASAADVACYRNYFADSTEWIRQHYFPDHPVLFR